MAQEGVTVIGVAAINAPGFSIVVFRSAKAFPFAERDATLVFTSQLQRLVVIH